MLCLNLIMARERKTDDQAAFPEMQGDSHWWAIMEYINMDHPDEDARWAHTSEEILRRFGLSPYSTAGEVRQAARKKREEYLKLLRDNGMEDILPDLFFLLGSTDNLETIHDIIFFLNIGEIFRTPYRPLDKTKPDLLK